MRKRRKRWPFSRQGSCHDAGTTTSSTSRGIGAFGYTKDEPADHYFMTRAEPLERVDLFTEGDELYDAMIAAIEGARRDIRLETFIFAADGIGRRFAQALATKARTRVDVRFHFDARGSVSPPSLSLVPELEKAGVKLKYYHPWSWWYLSRYFQRNHRKLLVVDQEQAFLGGFNIRAENSRSFYGERRQRDTHVRVYGGLARQAADLFDRMWAGTPQREAGAEGASDPQALLVPNISRRGERRLASLYEGLVDRSERYVYLTTPYFCPATVIGEALRNAARRGVDARLLVPRKSDPPFVGWGTRAVFSRLLASGVRVYEYLPRKLHAKTAVIDGEWSIVGSSNLDYLSLRVNHEIVLIARHRGLATALREQYFQDLSQAGEVVPVVWTKRPWRERLMEVVGRAAYRLF